MNTEIYDVIFIGAGASGLFCANNIGKEKSVLILEGSDSSAKKLLLSAKGRGNLTNRLIKPRLDYVCDDVIFVEKSFEQYGCSDFLLFLEKFGIEYKEEDFGRILLKNNKVFTFQQFLLNQLEDKNASILYDWKVEKVKKEGEVFYIYSGEKVFKSKNLVVAIGGPSFPQLGASGIAIDIARTFDLDIMEFSPALVGFETEKDFSSLSGSSVKGKIILKNGNSVLAENEGVVLFTHWGVSGPGIFNASLYLRGKKIEKTDLKIEVLIDRKEITKRLLAFLGFRGNNLNTYKVSSKISQTRGLNEAKVCSGGVKTSNLKQTFECKDIPGLYFIGECLDVTGKTGGFNLQWCWTSAAICAKSLNGEYVEND